MQRELPRTAWYGDPESLELRDALAAKHGCTIENIVVGAGIDDLLGMIVRGFLGPGGVAVATAGTYPTFAYHVVGRRRQIVDRTARRRTAPYDSKRCSRRAARRPPRRLSRESGQPERQLHPAAIGRAVSERSVKTRFMLDEAYGDFLDPRTWLPDDPARSFACERFRKPTEWPERGSATRSPAPSDRDVPKDPPALTGEPHRADRRARRARTTGFRGRGRRRGCARACRITRLGERVGFADAALARELRQLRSRDARARRSDRRTVCATGVFVRKPSDRR